MYDNFRKRVSNVRLTVCICLLKLHDSKLKQKFPLYGRFGRNTETE